MRHHQFLDAGARIFGLSIDSPARNSAWIQKLSLPFPLLSDPDRTAVIRPYGVADEVDERQISLPAMIVLTPEGEEVFRFVSRDYADRLPEVDVIQEVEDRGLAPTSQAPPRLGPADPGPGSLAPDRLKVYFRGARFAALALGRRHAHLADEIKQDSKAYVAEMDRFTTALDWLRNQRGD